MDRAAAAAITFEEEVSRNPMRKLLVVLLIAVASCQGQPKPSATPARNVELGMDHEQVYDILGLPEGYVMRGLHYARTPRFLTAALYEVFLMKVGGRKFELRLSYEPGDHGNRSHPGEFVNEVLVAADRAEPAEDLLKRFDITRDLCSDGCVNVSGAEGCKDFEFCLTPQRSGVNDGVILGLSHRSRIDVPDGNVTTLRDLATDVSVRRISADATKSRLSKPVGTPLSVWNPADKPAQ